MRWRGKGWGGTRELAERHVDEKLKKGKYRGSLKNKQQTKLCACLLFANNENSWL